MDSWVMAVISTQRWRSVLASSGMERLVMASCISDLAVWVLQIRICGFVWVGSKMGLGCESCCDGLLILF